MYFLLLFKFLIKSILLFFVSAGEYLWIRARLTGAGLGKQSLFQVADSLIEFPNILPINYYPNWLRGLS
jgi:hypothetical protein